jgi:hypothetical protein
MKNSIIKDSVFNKFSQNVRLSILLIIIILTLIPTILTAQDSSKADFGKFSAKGHLQYLENVWLLPESEKWQTMGQIYNRLDFKWEKGNNISTNLGMRNISNYGQMVYDYYPYLENMALEDYGLVDLTFKLASDSSYYAFTNIDRANLDFSWQKLDITIGRQRINWGINMVWNPNDIFNTFNYFDFDYIERPGCDAVFVQYYNGMTSAMQFAWKIDSDHKSTVAGMYKFNKWNYDFQVFGGVARDDVVFGGGWSGQIEGAGFTGETSYFIPTEKSSDNKPTFILSGGANYTFPNSFYIHSSMIYNSQGTTGKAFSGDFVVVNRDISAKTLTPSRMEILCEIAYQISPLIRGDIAGIINPFDGSAFVGPSFDISLTQNLDLTLVGQLFFGESQTEYGDYGQLYYGRLKWSF